MCTLSHSRANDGRGGAKRGFGPDFQPAGSGTAASPPMVKVFSGAGLVLTARLLDRVGKSIRGALFCVIALAALMRQSRCKA